MRFTLQTIAKRLNWGLIVALILPLIAIVPTFGDGIANGSDATFHTHRIFAMTKLIEGGNLWPRWVTYFHVGYGYPIFNFYAPGATYVGALFQLIGFSTTVAYTLVNAAAWMIGSAGIYGLARCFLPVTSALLAAALWVYAPSRFFEFWLQGSLAQTVATALIPFVFLGVVQTARYPKPRNLLIIAFSFAGIVLSHTPMTYITALFAVPACFLIPLWEATRRDEGRLRGKLIKRWILVGSGFVLAGGLSAIFLIPVFAEVQYTRIAGEFPDTAAYLISQFPRSEEIFSLPHIIDQTDIGWTIPKSLGLIGGVLSLLGFAGLLLKKRYSAALLLAAGTLFAVFMTLEISLDVWLTIPGFENLRFPERILRVGAVLVALLGGASLLLLPQRWRLTGLMAASGIVILQAMPLVYPFDNFRNWETITAASEIEMEATEYIWGTTSYDEFEPIWGEEVPLDPPSDLRQYEIRPFIITPYGVGYDVEQISDNTLRITLEEDRAISFRQYYFPGWTVTNNGSPIEIYPEDRFGLITADLPAGENTVTLAYTGTPVQHTSTLITVISLGIAVGLFISGRRIRTTDVKESIADSLQPQYGLILVGGIIVIALMHGGLLANDASPFRYSSEPDTPLYMQTQLDIDFGRQVDLLGYTLDNTAISPDHPLDITLYWRVPEPTQRNYRPIVQIVNMQRSEAWAVSEPFLMGADQTSNYTPEVYSSDRHRLRLFDDAKPYVGQISIQLVDEITGQPLLLEDGGNRLLLDPIIQVDNTVPDVQKLFHYTISDVAEMWCASIQRGNDALNIDVYWHLLKPADQDLVVLVHGLNSEGDLIEQNDQPPFGNNYPAIYWRAGQTLIDHYTLPDNPAIASVGLGLYTREGVQNLAITETGEPVANNRILLPVEEIPCLQ